MRRGARPLSTQPGTEAREVGAPAAQRQGARRHLVGLSVLLAGVALVGAANLEVTTKQGLNFEVSAHRLPLYLKSLQFIDRSVQYQQIADEITQGATSDSERALAVFAWTKRHIRTTPEGWPVVDDHILNIIIRGHGVNDQQADVFATLLTYAGVPAFWSKVSVRYPEGPGVILSFARVDGRWRVFDVYNDIVFRTASGDLAAMDDLHGHLELVPEDAPLQVGPAVSYSDIVTSQPMPAVPHPLRAELQMPSARVWYELKTTLRPEPRQ